MKPQETLRAKTSKGYDLLLVKWGADSGDPGLERFQLFKETKDAAGQPNYDRLTSRLPLDDAMSIAGLYA